MKEIWFHRKQQLALPGLVMCLFVVFGTLGGSGLASAQTIGAHSFWACCPWGGPCNTFCPFPSGPFLATPWGWTGDYDSQPTFSEDGRNIAFIRNADIYVVDVNLSPVNITNTTNNRDPAWSPDGTRIAFVSTRDGQWELYLMNPDGSNVRRLTYNLAALVGDPAWSPDSKRITFNCQVDSGNDDICAINADGTSFVRLTADSAWDSGPTWSPDGLSIAFSTTRYATNDRVIAVMNADGTGVTQLGTGVEGWSPVWAPNGAQIAFEGTGIDYTYGSSVAIYTMNADGTNAVLFAYDTGDPAWIPDQVPIATLKFTCVGTICNFDASGSKDPYAPITSYAWDFGDQTTGTGAIVSHTFASGGANTVKLTVTDTNGATGTKFQNLNFSPVAAFTLSCSGLTCNLDASDSKESGGTILSYNWTFGDGASGTGVMVNHTYSDPNCYNITLTVSDGIGATGTQTRTIEVGSPPHASFSVSCDGLTCNFDGSSSVSGGTIVNYSWNFGDGTAPMSGASKTVSHRYATGNSYNVTLTVADDLGATSAQSRTININSSPHASIVFACNLLTCSVDGSYSFDPDGTVVSYVWNFGDGTVASGPTISHSYAAGGYYNVTLTVADNAGATGVQSVKLFANSPPVASFTFSCNRLACSFDGSTSHDSDDGIVMWSWNFGDGRSGSNPTTTHTYLTSGTYVVTLTVRDAHGATGIQSTTVKVSPRKQ